MKRHETNQKIDEAIFRRTAMRTKKINVQTTNMRGGIRF